MYPAPAPNVATSRTSIGGGGGLRHRVTIWRPFARTPSMIAGSAARVAAFVAESCIAMMEPAWAWPTAAEMICAVEFPAVSPGLSFHMMGVRPRPTSRDATLAFQAP